MIPIKDTLAREFYSEMCRVERWSVRQLRERIDSNQPSLFSDDEVEESR